MVNKDTDCARCGSDVRKDLARPLTQVAKITEQGCVAWQFCNHCSEQLSPRLLHKNTKNGKYTPVIKRWHWVETGYIRGDEGWRWYERDVPPPSHSETKCDG